MWCPALSLLLVLTEPVTPVNVEVLEELTQKPIEGVEISIADDASWVGITDENGLAVIALRKPPMELTLQRTGYVSIDTVLSIVGSPMVFHLQPAPLPMPGVEIKHTRTAPGEWDIALATRDTIRPVEELRETLETVPGVRVPESGSGSGAGGISIRGASPLQTETWLDGMPLVHSRFGGSELDGVLPGVVERLTVFQGWTPQRLGGTGIGGGVELETLGETPRPQFHCRTGIGSYGRVEGALGGGTPIRGGWVRAHLELLRQENDFKYVDDNATPLNTVDDSVRTRKNNRIEVANLLLKGASAEGRFGRTILTSLGTWRREGVPGPAANSIRHVSHEAWEERLILKHFFGSGDNVQGIATLYQECFNSRVVDPEGELAFYSSTRTERGFSSGGRLFIASGTWNHLRTDARLESRWEQFRSEIEGSGEPETSQRRRTLAGGAGLTWLGSDKIRSRGEIGVISYADHEDKGPDSDGSVTTGRVAAEYTLASELSAALSWSTQERPPTLFELYGNQGSVKGNADLKPEEGTQVEAVLLGWGGRFRLAAYMRQVENLIQFWLRSPRVILPENVGEAEMKGLELSVHAKIVEPVNLIVRGSYQETEDQSNVPYYRGNELPGRPKWKGHFGVNTRLSSRTRCGIHLRFESDFYRDRANRRLEDDTTKLGAWIELRGLWNLIIRLSGENLTDELGTDQWGYPLPGRRVRVTLSYPTIDS